MIEGEVFFCHMVGKVCKKEGCDPKLCLGEKLAAFLKENTHNLDAYPSAALTLFEGYSQEQIKAILSRENPASLSDRDKII